MSGMGIVIAGLFSHTHYYMYFAYSLSLFLIAGALNKNIKVISLMWMPMQSKSQW